jgi:hypothetical protein
MIEMKTLLMISTILVLVISTMATNNVFAQTTPSYVQNMTLEKIDTSSIYKISNTHNNETLRFDVFDWSQNGKLLAFKYVDSKSNAGSNHMGLMDLNTKKTWIIHTTTLSDHDVFYDAKFSKSDDNSIFILLNGDIYRYMINNDTLSRITTHYGIYLFDVLRDGNLVYPQQGTDSKYVNGTYLFKHVLWLAGPNATRIKELYSTYDNINDFEISPDEKKIALITYHSNGSSLPPSQFLKIANLATNQTTQLDNIDYNVDKVKWSPNSQLLVYHYHGWMVYGGTLEIRDTETGFDKVLYSTGNVLNNFIIDSDGKSIIFVMSSQIYKMDLLHPIPEFPFTIPILLVGIMSILVFYRVKSSFRI